MTKRERFIRTIERKEVDKPAKWLGIPVPDSMEALLKYFGVSSYSELKGKIDDDVWNVELPYHNGTTNAIYMAFDFNKKHSGEYTLTGSGFFEDYEKPSAVELFNWPDPAKCIDPAECKKVVDAAPEGYAVMGVIWAAHFQDACAAFGMEDALIKMKLCPELFQAVIDRITEFYLKANEIFYTAAKGKLDAVLIGNDFGTQTGLIVSAEDLRRFVFKGTKRLIDQAHSHGLKVIYHSCGAISEVIPDIIQCGADVIHPIQALATGMDPNILKEKYGGKVSFCGGVDAQYLLVTGGKGEIIKKVLELETIFPTGLIISPSHEAILPDVPPENIDALFNK